MIKILVIVLNSALIFTIAWQIWKRQDSLRQLYWPALAFKLLCGVSLGLLYTYYYSSGDTLSFFKDGRVLSAMARDDLGEYIRFLWSGDESFSVWNQLNYQQYRSLFFTKWISVINLLTYDNYWLTSIYFSFISFLGAFYLSRRIVKIFPDSIQATAVAFLFFPSVIFWSSGVIKEAIALPGIFFLSGVVLNLWHNRNLKLVEWILLPLIIWCVWKLKYFYLAIFLPLAITTLVIKILVAGFFKVDKLIPQLLISFFLLAGCLFAVSFLHPNFHLDYLPEVVVMNNQEYTRFSSPENVIHFDNLQPDFSSIAKNSPEALISGIFRPGIWEANSVLKFLAALENMALTLLIGLRLWRWNKISFGQYRLLTFAALAYIVLLCIFLSLATPNIGTLVRYRIGFIPFLVFILLNGNDLVKSWERLFLRLVRHN